MLVLGSSTFVKPSNFLSIFFRDVLPLATLVCFVKLFFQLLSWSILSVSSVYSISYRKYLSPDDDDDDDMMNCFCGMVDRQKAFRLISSRDHCQRSSPSQISDTPRAGFEPAQSPSSGLVEWSCVVVITIAPQRHK